MQHTPDTKTAKGIFAWNLTLILILRVLRTLIKDKRVHCKITSFLNFLVL